jgi:hypothetical protein
MTLVQWSAGASLTCMLTITMLTWNETLECHPMRGAENPFNVSSQMQMEAGWCVVWFIEHLCCAGITLANVICACCYFFVAICGYASYGDTVADNVLASQPRPAKAMVGIANFMVWLHVLASFQVFSHPIFESVETFVSSRLQNLSPLVIRLVWRTAYVLLVTIIAASFPFFGEIVGLLGAVGFIPMTFIMPHVLWLVHRKGELGPTRFINYALVVVFIVIAFLALIGSIASIAYKRSTFEYWT